MTLGAGDSKAQALLGKSKTSIDLFNLLLQLEVSYNLKRNCDLFYIPVYMTLALWFMLYNILWFNDIKRLNLIIRKIKKLNMNYTDNEIYL